MKRLTVLPLILVLSLIGVSGAFAAWLASGSGTGTVDAGTLGAGNAPSATITSRVATQPSASVGVSWTGTDNAQAYEVERWTDGSDVDTDTPAAIGAACDVPVETLSCTESGVAEGIWQYRVRPLSGAWVGDWSPLGVAVPVVPASPSIHTLTPSANAITVAWTDNSDIADQFRIERSADGGGTWAQISGNATSPHVDGGLTCGDTYDYRVLAHDSTLNLTSPPSASASATTGPCTMHVSRLEMTVVPTGQGQGRIATATVTVRDSSGTAVDGVVVTGAYSTSAGNTDTASKSCTTGASIPGTCVMASVEISNPNGNMTFTVTGATGSLTYDANSSATSVTVPSGQTFAVATAP